jgi:demethylmenaquinone methyltransferase/2-methoxy-6-polyprenyl-1,4-benzoquinol methylase
MERQPTLATAFTAPEVKRRYVRRLFATIADRYDLITVLLSFGRDRHWKTRLVSLVAPGPDARVLDLACGTGDIAFESAARGAQVVGVDITLRMLELAIEKRKRCRVNF